MGSVATTLLPRQRFLKSVCFVCFVSCFIWFKCTVVMPLQMLVSCILISAFPLNVDIVYVYYSITTPPLSPLPPLQSIVNHIVSIFPVDVVQVF